MLAVFALTLFVSATLLFLIEPMVGKMVTPLLGGTPAVWNTCMVFFQAVLLAGYAYSHAVTGWLGVRRQAWLQIVVLALPFLLFLVFPLTINKNLVAGSEENPIPALLLLLTLSVGVPFFVVSTSAPLLQKWFADTEHPAARDPYFLYGASNLGSMLTLIGYPLVVEPHLTLAAQRITWMVGYAVLVLLTIACAVFLWKSPPAVATVTEKEVQKEAPVKQRSEAIKVASRLTTLRSKSRLRSRSEKITTQPDPPSAFDTAVQPLGGEVTWARRLRWVLLAAVPSSLMLGVTTYMTTDIAAIPLLWVLPLAIYLLTFIIVFSNVPAIIHKALVLLLPLTVLFLLFTMLGEMKLLNIAWTIALHLFTLFVVAMVCHGELARDRPSTEHLTEFFLWMSAGGVVGGLFNALVAPLVFNAIVEYQLAMVIACLLTPALGSDKDTSKIVTLDSDYWLYSIILPILFGGPLILLRKVMRVASVTWEVLFDFLLVIIFTFTGALLIFLRSYDGDTSWSAFAESRWGWPLAGLLLVIGVGLLNALLTRQKRPQHWLDLALPLSLAILVVGLVWGLYSDSVWPRVVSVAKFLHLRPAQFYIILAYGLPAVFCYTFVERQLRFGLGVAAMLLASSIGSLTDDSVAFQTRSFFGVLKVENDSHFRRLVHGTTMHGKQFLDPDFRQEPLTYYHRTGPIGEVMMMYNQDGQRNLAVIGLGTGTMACYARPGQNITFYDIDPAVRDISFTTDKYFTYVKDAKDRGANVDLVLGDARLTMERKQLSEAEKYGIIVVDAFSSDAIPIHLITLQALDIFLDKMSEDGILAFHISNRYLDLRPVLANLAEERNLACLYQSDDDESYPGKARSTWVMLARKEEYLSRLKVPASFEEDRAKTVKQLTPLMCLPDFGGGLSGPAMMLTGVLTEWRGPGEWKKPETRKDVGVWTDDYSNLFSVFSF
jgi:Ca2+/Na+ antiporter